MTPRAIAWVQGQWGTPEALSIALDDRGLLLADGLFETILVRQGDPQLLSAHLQRWHRSATLLAMAPPPSEVELLPLIREAVERGGLQQASGALRLNWSRGPSRGRGINMPEHQQEPRFWLQLTPHTPAFEPVTAIISRQERRNRDSLLSQCKTFAYGQAIQARREAQLAGAEEALLLNTAGELCCGAAANLLVLRRGTWLTPPLSSGCLPGVMRARLLELKRAREAPLAATPEPGDQWLLINSLSCRPILSLDGQRLEPHQGAEALWWDLL
jgi:branched-chain amino acid aminotransferase